MFRVLRNWKEKIHPNVFECMMPIYWNALARGLRNVESCHAWGGIKIGAESNKPRITLKQLTATNLQTRQVAPHSARHWYSTAPAQRMSFERDLHRWKLLPAMLRRLLKRGVHFTLTRSRATATCTWPSTSSSSQREQSSWKVLLRSQVLEKL